MGSKIRAFDVGSEVEVRSNEKGFVGGWFEATVTGSHRKRRRYSVAYSALVTDEESMAPIQATVHLSFIRPRPPPSESGNVFGLHEAVEAYHNDGWWKGVVVKLPGPGGGGGSGGDSLYSVCFPATREEFQFKGSEIRRHREWLRGEWVDVKPQKGIDVTFGVGTQVEVSRDKENFGAAWFVGTVIKIIGKRSFLVEYENLRVNGDNGTTMLLKEIVDLQYIRPCPPASESTSFVPRDEVEGFHKDSWFVGVVLQILPGYGYRVEYKHEKNEMVLDHNSIRPRLVWFDGCWIDISRDNHNKIRTLRASKSSDCSSKSSLSKRSSSPMSLSSPRDGGDGAGRLKKLKKYEKKHTSKGQLKSSETHKESKKSGFFKELQLANGLSQGGSNEALTSSETKSVGHKRKSFSGRSCHPSMSVSSFSPHDGPDYVKWKSMKKVSGPCLEDRVEFSQPIKKLKLKLKLERKMTEPSFNDRDSSQPSKKSKKVKALEEDLQLVDGSSSMAACGSKTSKRSSSSLKNTPSCTVGPKSQRTFFSREIYNGKKTAQQVNDSNRSIIHGKGSPSCLGERIETNQSKEITLYQSSVRHEASDAELIADCGNFTDYRRGTSNTTKIRRKKVVSRFLYKHGTSNSLVEELNELKGSKTAYGGMVPELLENRKKLEVGSENSVDLVDLSNQTPYSDISNNVLMRYHRRKAKEGEKSCLIPNIEGDSVVNDVVNNYSKNLADVTEGPVTPQMESSTLDAKFLEYPKSHHSLILKYLNSRFEEKWVSLSELVKSVDGAETHVFPSNAHNLQVHDELNQIASSTDKVAGVELSPIAPTITKPSNNFYDQNEFTPSTSQFEKEIKDGAHIDPSPCKSSLSMEDRISVHNVLTSRGSLFRRTVLEMEKEKAPSDSIHSGLSSSRKEIGHYNELISGDLPSGGSHSSINGIEEIQSYANELVVTVTGERDKQAPPSPFNEHTAEQSNEFALTGPSSARVSYMENDNETAIICRSLQASTNEKIELPFTKKSKMWELVESGEVFHILPQKPHFHSLLEYAEELREGIAIGLMMSFESLVTDTSSLCVADSQQRFEKKLMALDHLEVNGFNVQPVRIWLGKLLKTHYKRSQSEGEKLYLNAKLLELEAENKKESSLVSSIDKAISELERSLTFLQGKRASMDLQMKKRTTEIVNLKTGVQAAEEASVSAELQFNATLAAPFR